jgi:tetratricopeptide (TPR) repeat protein
LAVSYLNANRPDEALKLREEALPLSRKVNGPEHPYTLGAMTNLAISLGAAGRLVEAIELHQKSLALMRKVNGPAHPDTLVTMKYLAGCYFKESRFQELAGLLSEHFEFLRRAGNGPDSEFHKVLIEIADEQVKGPVEQDAIARYYAKNKETFRETSVHLYTIAIELETTEEARAEQRKKAAALRDEIANGKPFAEVALEHSEDPYASDGGDNLTVKRGDRTEPLNSAIFALKPGVPDLHDDGRFLRILKVEDRVEGEIAPLEEVREDIAGILLQQRRDELLRQWQEEAREKVDIWELQNKRADDDPERVAGKKEIPSHE